MKGNKKIVKEPASEKIKIYLQLAVVAFIWSTNFIIGKYILAYAKAIDIAFLRFLFATLGLLVILIIKNEFTLIKPKEIVLFFILGNCGIGLYNALIYLALEYTTAVNASLVKSLNPVVGLVGSWLFLKEKINFKQAIAIVLSIAGIMIITIKDDFHNIANINQGDLLIFISIVLWTAYNIISKKTAKDLSALQITFWSVFFGMLSLAPFSLPQAIANQGYQLPLWLYGVIAYLGIGMTTIGMLIWQKGIKKISVTSSAMIYNLIPFFSLLLSIVFLRETIDIYSLVGAVMILAATVICVKAEKN